MLSGMLLGHMPSVGMTAVAVSGLVTRNVYEPLFPGRAPKHYLRVGQALIAIVLLASIGIAWGASSLGSLTTIMITFNTFFGAVIFLLFFWRRLTVPAILISFFIWMFLQAVVPPVVGYIPALRTLDVLTLRTQSYQKTVAQAATAADVSAGRATTIGQTIAVATTVPPAAIFFDKVAPQDPNTPEKGYEGLGHFTVENAVLYFPLRALGLDMPHFSKAQLVTTRWLFDGLFPSSPSSSFRSSPGPPPPNVPPPSTPK